jgi:hypothetical protein
VKRDPWIDRWIGHLLMRRARWLAKHSGLHEARHYLAALEAGDSTACGDRCRLSASDAR